jgi:hypothetical protein
MVDDEDGRWWMRMVDGGWWDSGWWMGMVRWWDGGWWMDEWTMHDR